MRGDEPFFWRPLAIQIGCATYCITLSVIAQSRMRVAIVHDWLTGMRGGGLYSYLS